MATPGLPSRTFAPLFDAWARRVRGRLALRSVLYGAALGLVVAMAPAVAGWHAGRGVVRAGAPLLGAAGAIAGLALARRRRWSDVDVAMYLDARLGSDETITTAVDLTRTDGPTKASDARDAAAVRDQIVERAADVLRSRDARVARPRVLMPAQAAGVIAAAALVVVARMPAPAHATAAVPHGAGKVRVTDARGLDRVVKLARLEPRDEAQGKRLEAIARDAEKLREDLARGIEQRDAQDRVARLRDALVAERLSLGSGDRRGGLEAASAKLREEQLTRGAGRALDQRDAEALDEAMEQLANRVDARDRARAHQSLEDAASAAARAGADDVAGALSDEAKRLGERGGRADLLRDLARAMKESGADDLSEPTARLEGSADDESARNLAEALERALGGLDEEQRKKLAENLAKMARGGKGARSDPKKLEELARSLASEEGQKRLADQLRELATEDFEGHESKRQQALDEAREGADEAAGQPSGSVPVPGDARPGTGRAPASGGKGEGRSAGPGDGPGGPGSDHDRGTASHAGQTNVVPAAELRARAHADLRPGQALPGTTTALAPGRAGGQATVRGTGDLRAAAPAEVGGVERSDVPEEYKEQVRRYFQP